MTDSARLLAWVDAQLPPSLARWLTQYAEIDAHHVSDVALLTAKDPVIFDAARAHRVGMPFLLHFANLQNQPTTWKVQFYKSLSNINFFNNLLLKKRINFLQNYTPVK